MPTTRRVSPPAAVRALLGDVQRAELELRSYLDGVAAAEARTQAQRLQRARIRFANRAIQEGWPA